MASKIGVLLLQTGTPDAPTPKAVKKYLAQFLADPRVIEVPRPIWWFILHLAILPFRPRASAEKYKTIWDEKTGSPLFHYTQLQAKRLQEALPKGFVVRFAMRYSRPTIPEMVDDLCKQGIERLLVFPMYPQYSATTTASILDELFRSLMKRRHMPTIRVVEPYYDHVAYINASVDLITETIRGKSDLDTLLLSFHGIPKAYVDKGDPYPVQCRRTFESIRNRLPIEPNKIAMSFQSRFGKQEWLTPYTVNTLQELARAGRKHVWIAAPGFTADCLETIEELGTEGAEVFRKAGGLTLNRIPCLNDFPPWIKAMKTIVLQETQGWEPPE